MPEQPAILLIAHGSRHDEANRDTRVLAQQLARRGPFANVVAAFLELAEPDIDAGAALCVQRGAQTVILLPHFLSAGTHVLRDLSAACARLASQYPHVDFRLAEPIGLHPLLLEILCERATTSL
jgi:sirohydrochlorin ferrochelatase